jgi:hypothetical protein
MELHHRTHTAMVLRPADTAVMAVALVQVSEARKRVYAPDQRSNRFMFSNANTR